MPCAGRAAAAGAAATGLPAPMSGGRAFLRSCRELVVPAALEISRSGEGAHVWVFFEEAVSVREARQLELAFVGQLRADQ